MKDDFKKRLIVSACIIFGSIVVASAALYFIASDLNAKADAVIRDRTLIAAQTTAIQGLAQLKRDAPKAAQYQAAMDALIPDQYHIVNFSKWLNDIAAKHGVVVTFAFQNENPPSASGQVGTAAFSIDVRGQSSAAVAFLRDIETQAAGFLLTINTFDLIPGATSTVELSAQGNLFFR